MVKRTNQTHEAYNASVLRSLASTPVERKKHMTIKSLTDQISKYPPEMEVYLNLNVAERTENVKAPADYKGNAESHVEGFIFGVTSIEGAWTIGLLVTDRGIAITAQEQFRNP